MAAKIVMPNVWAWLAEWRISRLWLIRLLTLGSCLSFVMALRAQSFAEHALFMLLFGVFWGGPLPQVEMTTLRQLGQSSHHYTRIRIWGSIGFSLAVCILGLWFERDGLLLLPALVYGLLVLLLIDSLLLPKSIGDGDNTDTGMRLWSTLRQPRVLALLGCCFLILVSHAPYYAYYSVYLEEHGYARGQIGALWALAVLAEIGIYAFMHRIVPVLGLRHILLASFLLAALRWLLLGYFIDSPWLQIGAQLLHAATFGTCHAAAVQFIHRLFPNQLQGRGQAIYGSLSFGAGLSLGSLGSAYLWQSLGAAACFQAAALISLLAFAIAWRWLH